MTEGTPGTGDEQRRDQDEPAAPGRADRLAEGQPVPDDERADETGDATAGSRRRAAAPVAVRHCACCANPLPPPTAQQKKPRKYCPDGAGGYEERYGITCAELGPAKEKYERVFGHEAVPGADLARLGEQVTTAQTLLGPESPLASLFAALTGTLTGVGERLDGTVAEALAETGRATAAEQQALGRERAAIIERDAANTQAQQAVLDRHAAERDRDTKVRAAEQRATVAATAQRAAEIAQGKAETERDLHKGRAERAEQAADIARAKLTEATETIAALNATVASLRGLLEQADTRADRERDRAEQAAAETGRVRDAAQTTLDAVRADAAEQIRTAQAAADATARAAREETAQRAAEHAATLERLGREHAAAVADTVAAAHHRTAHVRRAVDEHTRHAATRLLTLLRAAPDDALRDGLQDFLADWSAPDLDTEP